VYALGHLAGDDRLRRVAEALGTWLKRAGALLCRDGGEDFGVILPQTVAETALQHAETLRAAIRGLDIAHPSSTTAPHVTVSTGAATAVLWSGGSPQRLVNAADEALYEAKRQGRDRCHAVVVAPDRAANG